MLEVNESTSGTLEADLVDENEDGVSGDVLDSALLTLTAAETGLVINGRTNVDITSYIDAAGHLAFPLTPLDTVLSADRRKPEEWRHALIVLLWDSGAKGLTERVTFKVKRVY